MRPSRSKEPPLPAEDETLDSWHGLLHLYQKKNGYRFSLDAPLLADFVRLQVSDRVLDLGTGCGIISLILSLKSPTIRLTGLEIQPGLIALADRNRRLNRREGQIRLIRGDISTLPRLFRDSCFDAVVSNPPYRPLRTGRINPRTEKALARHEVLTDLPRLMTGVRHVLKDQGRLFLIYPARRLAALMAAARGEGLEPKRLRLVHSFAGSRGAWTLLEALKNGKEELTILPPLPVYERPGVYSPEARRILSG